MDAEQPVLLEHQTKLAQELLVGVDILATSSGCPELDLSASERSRFREDGPEKSTEDTESGANPEERAPAPAMSFGVVCDECEVDDGGDKLWDDQIRISDGIGGHGWTSTKRATHVTLGRTRQRYALWRHQQQLGSLSGAQAYVRLRRTRFIQDRD